MKSTEGMSPAELNQLDAAREFDAAHAKWMDTPAWHHDYNRRLQAKDEARRRYVESVEACHPTWIVM